MNIKTILSIAVGLMVFFVMASAVFMTHFRSQYEHGFGTRPCNADSSCTGASTNLHNQYCTGATATKVACTNCNISSGYEGFLDTCYSLIDEGDDINDTYCYQCSSFGFRTTSQGLGVLVFVLAVIGIAVAFFKAKG